MGITAPISVIIPAYNPKHFLSEALESVQAQTLQPQETIVIDDGSTPSISIPDRLTIPVRLVRQTNSGQAAARNNAMGISQGEWLAFLDADDVWHPRKLELQMREVGRNPDAGVIGCRSLLVNENGEFIGKGPGLFSNRNISLTRHTFINEAFLAGLIPSMALVKKACVEGKVFFERQFQPIEDIVFFDLLLSRGVKACLIDQALLKRRMHGENLTYRYRSMLQSCLLWIKERIEPAGIQTLEVQALAYLVAGQSALLMGNDRHSRSLLKKSFGILKSGRSVFYFLMAVAGSGIASHFRKVKRWFQTQVDDCPGLWVGN